MRHKIKKVLLKLHPKNISDTITTFIRDESIGGKLILVATLLSLLVVNTALRDTYSNFWHTHLSLGFNSFNFNLDFRHWLNEGLMALFFLVVGLEIKREIISGKLQDKKSAILPIGAAIGGMILPAFIFFLFNAKSDSIRGWGIPIATDIAFAVTILSLLGKRVPLTLKVFLLTLAIADDIGAIIIIALFYAEIINYSYLWASVGLLLLFWLGRKYFIDRLILFMICGVVLWAITHQSGIHASIVGALMGLLAPMPFRKNKLSVSARLEKFFLPITTFVIVPLFAFANAGFIVSKDSINGSRPLMLGIIIGLIAGKSLGITGASWLLVKLKFTNLPTDIKWRQIFGVGLIAGIGFTVSIFITELAFSNNQQLIGTAKLSIFVASALSALLGIIVLKYTSKKTT